MKLKKPIGGFFELELPKRNNKYHKKTISLTNGRACLNLILKIESPKSVYVPAYTCMALYEPLLNNDIEIKFYKINKNLEPIDLPELKKNELFIYINYFGIKDSYCTKLIKKFKSKVVIDNTHQFFHKGYKNNYSFTSARKYFGVPDGAYLYLKNKNKKYNFNQNKNISLNHNIERLSQDFTMAYNSYLKLEKTFNSNILKMSIISQEILKTIDYKFVRKRRKRNFEYLHDKLKAINHLNIDFSSIKVAFCYPLVLHKKIDKSLFHKKNLFIPILWTDTFNDNTNTFKFEKDFSEKLIPIPIDHRYKIKDMKNIVKLIKGIIHE